MTRPPRLEYAGARYHVINRGNFRQNLFENHGSAEAFERTLGEAAQKFGWKITAYVVMRNHFHLALETPEPNLSVGMKWLQGTWTRRVNRFRSRIGRPFQDRFKSLIIEDGEGFRRVCDYIHLNPVRAHVVEVGEIGTYPHCSLWHYLQGKPPAWLDADWLLMAAGGLKNTPAGWRAYCVRLGVMMGDKEAREKLNSKHLSRGWCVGGKDFKKTLQEGMKQQMVAWRERRFAGLEPDEAKEERMAAWQEALETYAHLAKIDLANLPPKKSAEDKVRLAAAMKSATSVSNRWLAERLAMGEPASVSQFVRRHLADAKNKRATEMLLSRM